ncbi:hypothetical protein F4808DRAFT_409794 [Astrocystis sublimbata]|nr:hypothetical protein F4808DRAFT_409794 [Astrocystis sublimbata]
MAAPEASQRVADIQRRAAEKPEVAFKAFDTYPWQADQLFIRSLTNTLYTVEPQSTTLAEVALQMRIDRFEERVKIKIDRDAYKQWLSSTGNLKPRLFSNQSLEQEVAGNVPPEQRRLAILHAELGYPPNHAIAEPPVDASIPSWQRAAPKAELFVPKNATPSPAEGAAVPYPKKFEEIVRFLETGEEIPGIRQIPDTVIDDPSISTRGTREAPLKPWERNSANAETTERSSIAPSAASTVSQSV